MYVVLFEEVFLEFPYLLAFGPCSLSRPYVVVTLEVSKMCLCFPRLDRL